MGCNHRWMIEDIESDEAEGQCYNCGEIRTFNNQYPDAAVFRPGARWEAVGRGGLPRQEIGPGCYWVVALGAGA